MTKVKISDITINLDNKRKPLNGEDRSKISIEKKYPYCGANNIMDYVDEYLFDEEIICIAEDGGKWGAGETCSYIMNEKCWINNHAHVLKVSDINCTDIRYLKYWLNHKDLNGIITGAIVKKLTQKALNDIEIDIPSIEEQRNISNKLDTISNLIEYKKSQILKLNELIKSQFVEMFKDVNESVRLGDCCEVHARIGWQALTSKEHMKTGDYMLITGTDFKDNEINYSTCVYVSKERYEMDNHIILKNDDILITKDGTIGKVAIVHNLPKPATLNGGVFVLRPDERFNKEYIAYVFKGPLFEDYVDKSKTGATIKHLNQKHLIEFCIPLPSMDEQLKFARIYKQIDKQKFEFENSLKKLEELQASLMQEYFG